MYNPVKVDCKYGAPMGRADITPLEGKVHLRRVRMTCLGEYDSGGAYWGLGAPLYCAYNDDGEVYIRAANRQEAKQKILTRHTVTFYR